MLLGARSRITVLVLPTLLRGGLTPVVAQSAGDDLARELKLVIDDYMSGWEPQFIAQGVPLDDYVDRSLRPFVRSPEFLIVIDDQVYPSFEEWESKLPDMIREHLELFREGYHVTLEFRALRTGPQSAAATHLYRYDFVDMDGRRGYVRGAISYLFVHQDGAWRIARQHGSHAQPVYEVGGSH